MYFLDVTRILNLFIETKFKASKLCKKSNILTRMVGGGKESFFIHKSLAERVLQTRNKELLQRAQSEIDKMLREKEEYKRRRRPANLDRAP
jgi:hypothetical protein